METTTMLPRFSFSPAFGFWSAYESEWSLSGAGTAVKALLKPACWRMIRMYSILSAPATLGTTTISPSGLAPPESVALLSDELAPCAFESAGFVDATVASAADLIMPKHSDAFCRALYLSGP